MKTKILTAGGLISSLVMLFGLFGSPMALAYSGSGSGTSQDPYIIDSCDQLEEINNNLSGNYKLGQSIDCTDVSNNIGWAPLGPDSANPFTGTFDGDGNSISGLTDSGNNAQGVFDYASGATIENVILVSPSIMGNSEVGGLVAEAGNNSNITNVNITGGTIVATDDQLGGIVGSLQNSTLSHSSFQNGTVTGFSISGYTEYIGGVVGYSQNSTISTTWVSGTVTGNQTGGGAYNTGGFIGNSNGDTILDSYSTADIGAYYSNETGGFVGLANSSTFNRTYATGTVNADNDGGGYAGRVIASGIEDSFAIGDVSGSNSIGGFIGNADSAPTTTNDDFWDQSTSGQALCIGHDSTTGSSASCTAVNANNSQPNYFFSKSNEPLSNWNFITTWEQLSSTTPQLLTFSNGTGNVNTTTTLPSTTAQPNIVTMPRSPDTGYGKPSTNPIWAELTLFGVSISLFAIARQTLAKPKV